MVAHFIGRQIIQHPAPHTRGISRKVREQIVVFLQRGTKRDDFSKQGTKEDNGVGYGSGTGHQMALDREGQEDFPGSRVQLFPALFWILF